MSGVKRKSMYFGNDVKYTPYAKHRITANMKHYGYALELPRYRNFLYHISWKFMSRYEHISRYKHVCHHDMNVWVCMS